MGINSYDDFINKTSSEKVVLAHIHGVKRLSNFSSDSGIYSQQVDHVVTEVSNGETALVSVGSIAGVTDSSKFYYDFTSGKLYIYSFSSIDDEIIATFRFFLSNKPISTSWNLEDDGAEVIYEPIIKSIPKFKSQMTQGKKSINLMGSGTISCDNTGSYFDGIYNKYIFDNKSSEIYSYNRELDPSQSRLIFRGRVTGNVYNSDKVDFNLTDDIYSLEQKVTGSQYLDDVVDSDRLNFKRRIYGKVDNLRIQSTSQSGKGLALTGTLTGTRKGKSVYGVGTSFTSELSEDDVITVAGIEVTVDRVLNDTTFTTSSALDLSFSNRTATYQPDVAYYRSNRTFQVASHALKEYSTTITNILSRNRFEVASTNGFKAGDVIRIGGTENKTVKRVSGNQIITTSNYNLDHSVGDTIITGAISSLKYGASGTSIGLDDFTVDNTPSGTYLTLSEEAEINSATENVLKYNFYFREGHSKIWLGKPTIFKFDTVANISGSLQGKYFVVRDEDNATVAFWFGDDLPEGTEVILEPAHGQSNSYKIPLANRDYTASEIAELCVSRVMESMDFYSGFTSSNSFTLETTQPQLVSFGAVGTSGFTHTSLVTGLASTVEINLSELISSRDFVRNADEALEYEVLACDSKVIYLRSNYDGVTGTQGLVYKNVAYIQDNTPVYVNCTGKTKDGNPSGEFIITAPEVVSDLLDDAGLSLFKDEDSFTESAVKAPQLVSMALPFSFEGDMPTIKAVVNKLNTSVLGSLFVTEALELGYDILDASIDITSLRTIRDDDILKWTVSGDGFDLSKTVIGNYRFLDYDPVSDDESKLQVTYTSEFVTKYVGNKNTREFDLYLYDTDEAQEQIERDELINSLSNSTIKLAGSLNLSKYRLGERVVLEFDRLYKALGGDDRLQVAVITSIDNNGEDVKLDLESLGALYSRAVTIADDSSVDDYSSSTSEDHLTVSFIVDDNGLINDTEDTDNTSLIS